VLPSLSNVVTALANGKLQSQVASCARARGLQQKPPLTPWSHCRWLQGVRGGSRQGEGKGKAKEKGKGKGK
jgi:hypothetical protein